MATWTVKRFNATKGFGFINRQTVEPTCSFTSAPVERAGMRDRNEGQKISMMLSRTSAPASRRRTISKPA